MARRAWYRASEYKEPFPEKTIGDGSTVECFETPNQLRCLVRVFPDGFRQEILFRMRPDGSTEYVSVGEGPESPRKHLSPQQRTEEFEQALASGRLNITARGPIPGAGLGVTYDENNRKRFRTSEEYDRYHEENKLSPIMRSDHSTRHVPTDADIERQIDVQMENEYAKMAAARAAANSASGGPPPVVGGHSNTAVHSFRVDSVGATPPIPRRGG